LFGFNLNGGWLGFLRVIKEIGKPALNFLIKQTAKSGKLKKAQRSRQERER